MRFVKLNEYIAIIGTLAQHGPLNPAQIVSLSSSIDYDKLKLALAFLLSQDLLLETSEGKVFPCYSITERGLRILKYFSYRTSIRNHRDGSREL
jgi:predicted transcriptional regulator